MVEKGSFIGFTFGNRHSSKLGIFRTSEGNRYSSNLAPALKEQTTDLATIDGTYHWNTNYTSREIPISFAFYGMSEEQIQQLKQTFNDKKIHNLILDEEPYKVWSAKLTGVAVCKNICFEDKDQRFYCGEGTFTFTTFSPYARSRYPFLEDYTLENVREWIEEDYFLNDEFKEEIIYPAILSYGYSSTENTAKLISEDSYFGYWLDDLNLLTTSDLDLAEVNSCIDFLIGNGAYYNKEEWEKSSRIPSNALYGKYENGKYTLFNAGDVAMPFSLYLPTQELPSEFIIRCGEQYIQFKNFVRQAEDAYILIDTSSYAVIGCNSQKQVTKNLYNQYITLGNFFDLPVGECILETPIKGQLDYKYLYL